MNRISKLFFATGAVFLVIGMAWGLQMAASHDHTLAPAHAHLNLIGFVLMSVIGTFYALAPEAAARPVARLHWALHTVAVIVIAPGIALAHLGVTEAGAIVGAFLSFASMILFVAIVIRTRTAEAGPAGLAAPAE